MELLDKLISFIEFPLSKFAANWLEPSTTPR